ncbi:MAG TPA: VCBS repeat-containing protein [Myxococcales bacterium]|nr:VCBS repeat-containing protein [Myxococcales bacterium]
MRATLLGGALCVALAACPIGAPEVDGFRITCATTADCRPGEVCDQTYGLCVAGPSNGDAGPTVCVIGGVTYDAGTFEQGQGCMQCQPSTNSGNWTAITGFPAAGGCQEQYAVCNAGHCASGCIVGGSYIPAGGSGSNACQICTPSVSQTALQEPTFVSDGGCPSGQLCSGGKCVSGCLIDGGFFDAGAGEPGAGCQGCMPGNTLASLTSWMPLTGEAPAGACSAGEICNSGVCQAGCLIAGSFEAAGAQNAASGGCQSCNPSKNPTDWTNASDGTSCTSGGHFCENGVCANVCDIGGQIEANGAQDPQNTCMACETANDPQNWSPVAGTAVACGTDAGQYCIGGSCAAACDLAGTAVASGTIDASNPCQSCQPTSSAVSYSNLPNGTACDAGGGTFCNSGSCAPECLIADAGLVSAGAPDPENPDECCVPLAASTGWTLGFAVESQTVATGTSPQGIAVADLNNDGKADLVAANLLSVSVSVSYGNGDGTFKSAVTFGTGNGPNSVALADFNGDSLIDMAIANSGDGTVSVLLNQGDGGFAPAPSSPFAVGPSPTAIVVGNFKTKTSVDLAVTDLGVVGATGNEVSILLNDGTGSFGVAKAYQVGNSPSSVTMADFDNDGFGDLAVANQIDGTVTVLSNNGNGTFATQATLPLGNGAPEPNAVIAADLNGDGKPDIAAASNVTNDVRAFLNQSGAWSGVQGPFAAGTDPTGLTAGNFSGHAASGFNDLAVANKDSGTVSLLIDTTSGAASLTFAPQLAYPLADGLVSIATGKFNGDSLPDLAAVNNTQKAISVLLGQCP